jgi:hypothetical protein
MTTIPEAAPKMCGLAAEEHDPVIRKV